jgi:hypothetical protein
MKMIEISVEVALVALRLSSLRLGHRLQTREGGTCAPLIWSPRKTARLGPRTAGKQSVATLTYP